MKKVIVVGIDSGDFKFIDAGIEQGRLPNFRKVIENGTSAVLNSTDPPLTPVAWTTMLSGLTKYQHGIFGWTRFKENQGLTPINSLSIKIPRIWNLVRYFGLDSLVIDVPLTYPAERINGLMISGFDSPELNKKSVSGYEKLVREFIEQFPDYGIVVDFKYLYQGLEKFLDLWRKDCEQKTKVLKYFHRKLSPPFSMLVYMIVDHLNHYSNLEEDEHNRVLGQAFSILDRELGKILKLMDEDTVLFIVSDHGSMYINKNFYINKWLEDKGFLKFYHHKLPKAFFKSLDRKLRMKCSLFKLFKPGFYRGIFRVMPSIIKRILVRKIRRKREVGYGYDVIDFNETTVFCKEAYGQVFLNDKILNLPAEKEKVKDKLFDALKNDSISGSVPGFEIIKKQKRDPSDINEPDIELRLIQDNIYFNPFNFKSGSGYLEPNQQSYKGDHRKQGIFIAYGSGIKSAGRIRDLEMVDFLPNLLQAAGWGVPEYMTGEIREDIFKQQRKTEWLKIDKSKLKKEYKND